MIRPWDESWTKNNQQMKSREAEQWWIWRANNLDAKHIIALWRESMSLDEVNNVLEKKWFKKIDRFPEEWDELYLDF